MRSAVDFPNWFRVYAQGIFGRRLDDLAGQPGLRFLQIGAFTGDATTWLLDNILTGHGSVLVDVDTWQGSDEAIHTTFSWDAIEHYYDQRTRIARQDGRLLKLKMASDQFFPHSAGGHGPFDFIYIDGAHDAYTVLNDAVDSCRVLKPGGIVAFDDYEWQSGKGELHDPRPAIDAFSKIYGDRLELLEVGAQAWFRKRVAA